MSEKKRCELCEEEADEFFGCDICGREVCDGCSNSDESTIMCNECFESRNSFEVKMNAFPSNDMEEKVVSIIMDEWDGGRDELKQWFKDLFYGGCQSGIVSDMIYYSDTLKFFNQYRQEINKLLQETISDYSRNGSPSDIFGDKWDKTDPLAMDTSNQNLLAWFAFEETARKISDRLGFEL